MTEVESPAPESSSKKEWYVLTAYAGQEAKVAELLRERIALSDHSESFGEVLVPVEEVVEMRAGQKRRRERKFFPGYILVQMEVNEATWQIVDKTPRIKGFVGGKRGSPIPISEAEAKSILDKIESGNASAAPTALFRAGDVVRVIDGPFVDFNGVVEEVNYEKSRLVVSVTIFGRSTPVELDFVQVEKG